MSQREPLFDGHGRAVTDLRVSVTDRCNFRCHYCMPSEGLPWLERSEVLSFEEITRLVKIFTELGVTDLRLTGGEPLVRKDLSDLVAKLSVLPGLEDLSITTNGYLLKRDASGLVEAGLKRFNVSLDALTQTRFAEVTRRDALSQVLEGLFELEKFPQLSAIKVNAVALRGVTEHEAIGFARLARSRPFQVRFIEFMPLDADQSWDRSELLTGQEVREIIESVYPLTEVERQPHATARVFRFEDGKGEIGFINPVSEPFCADCNRVRLTAEGKLRTCLFSLKETDLRGPLREGASDEQLEVVIREAVWAKELKHSVGEVGFVQPQRTMSRIGG